MTLAKKIALVIGNSAYSEGRLANPTNDADLIASTLGDVGFKVMLRKDIKTAYKMKEIINVFTKKLKKSDIAVVYYAGHGVQYFNILS
ncbi:MAG: caspase family protein [Campylobacterota bacterium]|nr:caspase family protein [Campylobacterota bacterium]